MTKIAFLGAGQMARALARGFVDSNRVMPASIHAYDPSVAATRDFAAEIPGGFDREFSK